MALFKIFKRAKKPWGYSWRSSSSFTVVCVVITLFAETFTHGFVIPILPYILEKRNNVDPKDTQQLTYLILTAYGATAVVSGPVIGQLTDRFKYPKLILATGLGIAFLGTSILATSTNLINVFIGRIVQAVGSTVSQVVGHATLNDVVKPQNMGMILGLVNVFISAGAFSGPAVSGFMLEYFGYWKTWRIVFGILSLDIVLRLLMIEHPKIKDKRKRAKAKDDESRNADSLTEGVNEYTSLIANASKTPYSLAKAIRDMKEGCTSMFSFYWILLSQPMILIGLVSYMTRSSLMASFNTTLPTHVRDMFGWGSFPAGMMFVALQAPGMVLDPLFGWIRRRGGNKVLTGLGFILLAPLLWLLGAVNQKWLPWSGSEDTVKLVYVIVIICIGCIQNLPASVGAAEITAVMEHLESETPGIFGPKGGNSRGHSLSNGSFNLGQFIGPLLSGSLADNLGYGRMTSTLCGICFVTSILSIAFMKDKSPKKRNWWV
ncbi:hypothetical protein MGYG_00198 [Nannizzia gypsea CBS 118893]|uniref:Major facilitator superfamily (MFS) profile domain-containing protein n=1 Tax=Arthroderma gypseum (strain ATCC MYA-4604 / CBS 118893) TaxID=535722 RepID=E5R3N1_ARTGP|nr:hypothetical protein MGYG_00198 [Nannizzia gypsea CBS 118893]EFQ97155.1 hypothetical protein MGYG_00198 [Nannizzia gypsea CBS 118893]